MRSTWSSAVAGLAAVVALGGCGGGGTDSSAAGQVSTHGTAGRQAMELALASGSTDDFLTAANEYAAAAGAVGRDPNAGAAQLDEARFFGGLARVALLAQPYSDGTPDGLADLGDVLDAFGLGGATRAERARMDRSLFLDCTMQYSGPYPTGETCSLKPLRADSPRSGQLVAFASERLAPQLRAAADLLHGVSPGFVTHLDDAGTIVEVDRTDALFLEAAARAMLVQLDVLGAYDLDVDLDALQASAPASVQAFLDQYPHLGRLVAASKLPQARTDALAALDAATAALTSLEAEAASDADQSDDLVRITSRTCTYDPVTYLYTCTTTYNPAQQIADLRANLQRARDLVGATGHYAFDRGTPSTADDVVVDPSKFFAGIDLRALVPTDFTAGAGGNLVGPLPDPTLGGLLVSGVDLTTDVDGDGSPDFFNAPTFFYAGYLQGHTLSASTASGYVTVMFAPTGATFTLDAYDYQTGTTTSYAGTYQFDRTVLTLTYVPPADGVTARDVFTVQGRLEDWGFTGLVETFDTGGALLGSGVVWFSHY